MKLTTSLTSVLAVGWTATAAWAATKPAAAGDLLISEIMYHPAPPSAAEKNDGFDDPDEFEFVELVNVAKEAVELKGVEVAKGVEFTFKAARALNPGQRVLLVKNRGAFQKRYGNSDAIAGNYQGALKNKGEKIEVLDPKGEEIVSVNFKDEAPWPKSADGTGFSIVLARVDKGVDVGDPANWRASAAVNGTPGKGDEAPAASVPGVLINEVIAHTDPPLVDSVEIHNPTDAEVDISGWFLSDDLKEPKKYAILPGTKIPAKGYVVLEEDTDDDPKNNDSLPEKYFGRKFSLSSHGDEIYLFSADAKGNLTGYSHGFDFPANQNGVSFGRHINSAGKEKFTPQAKMTLGAENAGPREEPVLISEILYRATDDDEAAEFVEIWNRSAEAVPLFDPKVPANTWQLDGVGFTFPKGVTLAPNEVAVIAHIEPEKFRELFHVPTTVKVFGPFEKALSNKGEKLSLLRPDEPDPEVNLVPMLTVDTVRYNDKEPWPEDADGRGPSIERKPGAKFSDDPAAWFASAKDGGTPGAPPKAPSAGKSPEATSPAKSPDDAKPKKDKKTSQVEPAKTRDGYVILRAQIGFAGDKAKAAEKAERQAQGVSGLLLWGAALAVSIIVIIALLSKLKPR